MLPFYLSFYTVCTSGASRGQILDCSASSIAFPIPSMLVNYGGLRTPKRMSTRAWRFPFIVTYSHHIFVLLAKVHVTVSQGSQRLFASNGSISVVSLLMKCYITYFLLCTNYGCLTNMEVHDGDSLCARPLLDVHQRTFLMVGKQNDLTLQ